MYVQHKIEKVVRRLITSGQWWTLGVMRQTLKAFE
jgi:hypothetical protein